MKKLIALILMAALMLCAPACFADEPANWYEVSADETVLTVRLDGNATTGYMWSSTITDGNVLELITDEYVENAHADGMVGVGGQYIASFKAVLSEDGTAKDAPVSVVFKYARAGGEPIYTAILDLYCYNNGIICVENSYNESIDDGSNEGATLSEDGTTLSIRYNCIAVENCVWDWKIDDTDILDEITSSTFPGTEGLTSGMGVSMFATNTPMKDETPIKAGETFVTVTYGAEGEGEVPIFNCVYKVTVDENGRLTLE